VDFRFTEEQAMIRDTAEAFLADASDSAAVRAASRPGGNRGASWSRIVNEMGWQALTVPEESGGLGLGYVELAIIQEAAGARLLVSPLFSTLGAGVSVLLACADAAQQAEWLAPVASGGETLALGVQGPGGAWGPEGGGLRYRKRDGVFELEGELAYVVDGAAADTLLVVALAADAPTVDSARVFRVAGNVPGLVRRACSTLDQTRALARLSFGGVTVDESALLRGSRSGAASVWPGLDLATIALAADLLGAAQASLEQAVSYTMEREQFGRPVAGFQAIKHKAADMMLRCECARSALYCAACVADGYLAGTETPAALAEAASIAKASCGDAAFRNAGEALQMHGGVGFTWEYDAHLYFKRARAGRALQGSSDWHRERIATQLLDPPSGDVAA
jgi:alkylation response protein AidB-like acyl-CoA dehydrogenase